ncbi:hypothetical protein AVEN_26330-1 [Araneus ventricosus]|uniref:Uncharacterized protein n=1 Tax=Araneus ventricosus TaxID=182803 RepID=A0A4Y2AM43_ARAVE|nr:hypothetical protein AVEN_26330-1 [Araneus ventricosus]
MAMKTVSFTDIPAKSPDASLTDFCAFELLKFALSERRPTTLCGLWKVVQEERDKIPLPIIQKALLSWKYSEWFVRSLLQSFIICHLLLKDGLFSLVLWDTCSVLGRRRHVLVGAVQSPREKVQRFEDASAAVE